MVTLLDIKRTYSDGGMRLLLLADSKEDTLPTLLSDIDGLSGAGGDSLRAKKLALILGE